ncbi:PhaM family polyhydroxyalkanoate granule multifunctional regulatory protein [Massilia horti]|uniref:Tfp pilus assembly protein FimV n=1 Tax=Massilia horti TaxID=2562153 RepID=A0A4Y9SVS7_9BURK|nr:PhaM family polyhydroxyalkanoate granule multifunctional regulatory protein [Massilia horti]TFW30820.1 hypothetical protein E4O92_15940 [Massilia horti]
MLKPPMPNIAGMTDTLDFVKNLWGSMSVPGFTAPTLNTDELDKRISDLKAVEAWLNMNITMLRGTIQALEVQRGTLATLKAMSASMAQAMGQPGADGTAGMPANPFQAFFTPPAAAPQQPNAEAPQPSAAHAPQAGAGTQQPEAGQGAAAATPDMGAAMPAAVAWWNLLQDQFRQAVASTMSPEAIANASAMAQEAAARMAAAARPPSMPAAPTDNASAQPGVDGGQRPGKPKSDKD